MKVVLKFVKIVTMLIIIILATYSFNYFFQLKIMQKKVPFFFGITHVKAVGDSMYPNIRSGSYLLIITQKEYMVGDVVCFYNSNNELITHRIIELCAETAKLKGDNTTSEEHIVLNKNIVGKVVFNFNNV